jgi:hypothetical protein
VARQELVQRRVNQPNGDGQPAHHLKDFEKVASLEGQQAAQRLAPLLFGLGEDHLLHNRQAFLAEKHVFGTRQPDALRAELQRFGGVVRVVGVRPHAQATELVRPAQ